MSKKKKALSNEEAFINAANYRSLEKIDELIDKVDINCQDQYGNTAMHYIARNSDYLLAVFFLEREANVNIQNNEGYTPLFAAVSTIIHEGMLFSEEARLVFTLLVSHGANIEELFSLREDNLDRFQLSTLDEIIETLKDVTFTAEEALDYIMEYTNGPEGTLENMSENPLDDDITTFTEEASQPFQQPMDQSATPSHPEELFIQHQSTILPEEIVIEHTDESASSTLLIAGLVLAGICSTLHH